MNEPIVDLTTSISFLLMGMALAYYGRRLVYVSRQLFGCLCGLTIYLMLLKLDTASYLARENSFILVGVGVLFCTLGVVAVHFVSTLLTLSLGILLGSALFHILIPIPLYLSDNRVVNTVVKWVIFAVAQGASCVFVFYWDYIGIIGSTAVVGSFMQILGADILIESGISRAFFQGIKEYQQIRAYGWICLQFTMFICIAVIGVCHQLTLY